MSHNLEQDSLGNVAFALRGAPAWHGLAQHIFGEDETVTTSQMLDAAKLSGWNVRLESVAKYAPSDYNFSRDSFMVLRDNPFGEGVDVLATVGERYKEVQNEELFSFADEILHGGGAWESAGSIQNGRKVFGSLVIPKEFTLDPNGSADTTKTYLLVNTSHDGSVAVQASITPVRVVCQNTLNFALRSVKQSFKVRHTQAVAGKVQNAREALNLTYSYMDAFEVEAQKLFNTTVSDVDWNNLITSLYPKPENDGKGAQTKWTNKIDLLNDLYGSSITNANIKGTAWGALNALTERVDYYRTSRGANTDGIKVAASGLDVIVNAEKNRIWKAVNSLVTA